MAGRFARAVARVLARRHPYTIDPVPTHRAVKHHTLEGPCACGRSTPLSPTETQPHDRA